MNAPVPRSSPALRVGVTGHRLNRLAPELRDSVRDALAAALATIDRTEKRSRPPILPGDRELAGPRIRLMSALAEGVDRIAAAATPQGWVLTAVLPMPLADYERDFLPVAAGTSASLDEFRSLLDRASLVIELPAIAGEHAATGSGRSRQYAMLGTYLVNAIDLLVAVWDGHPAEGPGGTATVVAEALEKGVRVLWIDAGRPERAGLLDRLPSDRDPDGRVHPADEEALRASIQSRRRA